jgi:hypothetical protein
MDFLISRAVEQKLKSKHRVALPEVYECFENRTSEALIDNRQQHQTFPPTQWFISKTDTGRELKVVFIRLSENQIVLKTAYDANDRVKQLYQSKIRG